jgi:predicted restriction endonuclease
MYMLHISSTVKNAILNQIVKNVLFRSKFLKTYDFKC